MSDHDVQPTWILALAAMFGIATASAWAGIFWNADFLCTINLCALLWTIRCSSLACWKRLWIYARGANLIAFTIYAGTTWVRGVSLGFQNLFWPQCKFGWNNWIPAVLVCGNYAAFLLLALRTRANQDERGRLKHLLVKIGLTSTTGLLLAVCWIVILAAAPQTIMVEQVPISTTQAYEKWGVDFGGSNGLECRVYKIRSFALIARYQEVDGEKSPIGSGCGF